MKNYNCKYCNFAKNLQENPGDYINKSQQFRVLHSNCSHEDRKLYDFHCDCSTISNKKDKVENFTVKNLPFFFADSFRNDEIYLSPQNDQKLDKTGNQDADTNTKTKKINHGANINLEKGSVNVVKRLVENVQDMPLDKKAIKDHLVKVNKLLSKIGKRNIIDFNEDMAIPDIIRFNDFLVDAIYREVPKDTSLGDTKVGKLSDLVKEFATGAKYDKAVQSDNIQIGPMRHSFSEGVEPDKCHDLRNKLEQILKSDLNNLNDLKQKFNELIGELDQGRHVQRVEYPRFPSETELTSRTFEDQDRKIDELERLNETLRKRLVDQHRHVDISTYEEAIKDLEEQNKQLHELIRDMNADEESISEQANNKYETKEKNERRLMGQPLEPDQSPNNINVNELNKIIEELSLIILSKENYEAIDTGRFAILKKILGENNISMMMSHAREKEHLMGIIAEMRGMVDEQVDVTVKILEKLRAYLMDVRDNVEWKNTELSNQTRTRLLFLIDIAQHEIRNHYQFKASIDHMASQFVPSKHYEEEMDQFVVLEPNISPRHASLLKKDSELTFKNFRNRLSDQKIRREESKLAPHEDEGDVVKRELSVEPVRLEESRTPKVRPVSSYDSLTDKSKKGIEKRELMSDLSKMLFASTVAMDRGSITKEVK